MNVNATYSSPAVEKCRTIIEKLLAEMVNNPEAVQIHEERIGLATTELTLEADARNYGAILGSAGGNLRGLKTICKLIGDDTGEKIELILKEIPGGERTRMPNGGIDQNWPRERIEALFQEVFDAILDRAIVVATDSSGGKTRLEVVIPDTERKEVLNWIGEMLAPIVKHIGFRVNRRMDLAMIRDKTLYDQARVLRHAA